jgi:hypothetical protein
MRKFLFTLSIAGVLAFTLAIGAASAAGGYSLFGNGHIVTPGSNGSGHSVEASSTAAPTYGGVDFAVPAGTTVNDVDHLSTDLQAVSGTCSTGTPRFAVGVNNGSGTTKYLFFYPTCSAAWSNTGNLASPTSLVDASQLGGLFYMPYAAVQAAYGSLPVVEIFLVVDSSNGAQTIRFDNTQINDVLYTYEPAPTKDDCKNSGFMNFDGSQGSPGPFKNQGDCVSYFASAK